jgi:alcohol dehydrogenase class IV
VIESRHSEIGEFIYKANAARVVFGTGSARHALRELDTMGCARALVLCTPNQRHLAEAVVHTLGSKAVAVFDQARCTCGAPASLMAIGMKSQDLDKAADIAMQNAYWNPRPLERQALRTLLQRAYEGLPPSPAA